MVFGNRLSAVLCFLGKQYVRQEMKKNWKKCGGIETLLHEEAIWILVLQYFAS